MTTMLSNPTRDNALAELGRLGRRARVPRLRTLLEFAEQEVIVPQGEFKGMRYRAHRHPVATLLLREIGSGRWSRVAVTGPVQDGKSFHTIVLPLVYHTVEQGYTVVVGAPDERTCKDKWERDLLPTFEASPSLRRHLPITGPGSKGAYAPLIQLRSGGAFRFMTGGGGDETRSAFTAEVALITEVDKMDARAAGGRETDKVTQIEARTELYRKSGRARTYLECTSSVPEGRITREITAGSDASPRLSCVHCGAYVLIEREHLLGWRDAADEQQALQEAHLVCPACGSIWSEADRAAAVRAAVLVHRGQEVGPGGEVTGPPPATNTLGFRWSSADSLFKSMGELGLKEWKCSRAEDREDQERELVQFQWARPYQGEQERQTRLSVSAVLRRTATDPRWTRDRVPGPTGWLVAGVDVGKYWLHWTLMAVLRDRRRHVVAYDKLQVASDDLKVDQAIEMALNQFHDACRAGWERVPVEDGRTAGVVGGHAGGEAADTGEAGAEKPEVVRPDVVLYDARYETNAVCRYLAAVNEPNVHLAAMGFGIGQEARGSTRYREPTEHDVRSGRVVFVGEGYKVVPRADYPVFQVDFDADRRKLRVHEALSLDPAAAGAMTLPYVERPVEHTGFARHLLAEQSERVFRPGAGYATKMVAIKNRPNHHFDATSMADIAAAMVLAVHGENDTAAEAPAEGAGSTPAEHDPTPAERRPAAAPRVMPTRDYGRDAVSPARFDNPVLNR